MKGLMTGDRKTHYEMRHTVCHMDTSVEKQVQSGEVGGQEDSIRRSFEPGLEQRKQGLVIARQRVLREEGRQMSLETPGGRCLQQGQRGQRHRCHQAGKTSQC